MRNVEGSDSSSLTALLYVLHNSLQNHCHCGGTSLHIVADGEPKVDVPVLLKYSFYLEDLRKGLRTSHV
ncbi:hypothetical protein T4B_12324 [Trichinella pseudospiralis]|uniref:Uncharacterized protein n=1 Tax=Trichinella pseudospiralis TaxID=6337 RepID=A0A0V1J2A7_TRIPS|nr:hypothetical protein T4B_12324 [Trichinella pseudospiralis]KRZ40472.1 hypothetical protein T4C_1908 [Trichinella pseudospiralis]